MNKWTVGIWLLVVGLFACKQQNTRIEEAEIKDSTKVSELDILSARIEENPMDPDLYYKRATYFYQKQKSTSGLADIRKAMEIDSLYAPFHLLYADLLYASGKPDSAAAEIETAIRLDPKNTEALTKMGELKYILKDYKAAFKYLDDALKLDMYLAKAYFIKGMCFKEQGYKDLAISSFQTAVEQDPDDYHAYIQLGNMYSEKKNDLAIDYYRNAITINPEGLEGYYNLGLFLQEAGRGEDALRVYKDLLKIDPVSGPALHNMGWVYLFIYNAPEMALGYFTSAINADPQMANAFYHRGYCYELLKDYKAARGDYQNAILIDPQFELPKKRMSKLKG